MSETELRVICKNCGSEVSPYVTECPYCGARLRKRAPKLERRGDALEPKPRRPGRRLIPAALRGASLGAERPYATLGVILGSAALILVQKATAYGVTNVNWFGLRDNNSAGPDFQSYFGLLRDDYSRKPAFPIYRKLIRRLGP